MSCTPQSRCLDDSKSQPGPDGDSSIFHFALLSAAQSIFNFPLHLLCEVHMKSTICCHCLAPSEVDFPACKSQGCLTGRKQSLQRNSTGCCDPRGNANLHGPLLGNTLYFRAQIYVVLGRGKQIGCVAVNSASSFGDSRAAMICRGYKSGPIVSNSLQLPFVAFVDFSEETFVEYNEICYRSWKRWSSVCIIFSLCLVASKEAFL